MPSPPREKGRVSRPRGSEEEFVLFLQGIPARCRWQELKDLVRQTALHIRQAVVYDDHHGFPTGLGQIIVKNEDEAWRTYQSSCYPSQNQLPYETHRGSYEEPILCSSTELCGWVFNAPESYPKPGRTGLPYFPRIRYLNKLDLSRARIWRSDQPHGHPTPAFMPIFTDPLSQPVPGMPNSPALRPAFCDPMAFGILPAYPMSHMHPPIMAPSIRLNQRRPNHTPTGANNSSNASIPRKAMYTYTHSHPPLFPAYSNAPSRQPGRRTIFIQNLSPTTTAQDLRNLLQEAAAGAIEKCEVPTDPETSRCKGFARVTLASAEEAKRAIGLYNNTVFMGSKIRVKIDRSIHIASYNLNPGSGMVTNPGKTESTTAAATAVVVVDPPTGRTDQMQPDGTCSSTSTSACSCAASESSDDEPKPVEPCETAKPPLSKPIDRCQPLVINGSGIGRTAAVMT
ncbi:hypothetical protein AOCH_006406 [Aspergillus ochraceoroseus]|uniref:RRM domain-containing protein n=1 Tax=Aspergillus ochraceoroseus TaxID=138278 RepID=A0A0F8UE65_9EURO|nr:hypothetical protein AOCH_006406 [Aspergillus ochraceoroseus]